MNCFTEVSSYIKSRHFDKAADLLKKNQTNVDGRTAFKFLRSLATQLKINSMNKSDESVKDFIEECCSTLRISQDLTVDDTEFTQGVLSLYHLLTLSASCQEPSEICITLAKTFLSCVEKSDKTLKDVESIAANFFAQVWNIANKVKSCLSMSYRSLALIILVHGGSTYWSRVIDKLIFAVQEPTSASFNLAGAVFDEFLLYCNSHKVQELQCVSALLQVWAHLVLLSNSSKNRHEDHTSRLNAFSKGIQEFKQVNSLIELVMNLFGESETDVSSKQWADFLSKDFEVVFVRVVVLTLNFSGVALSQSSESKWERQNQISSAINVLLCFDKEVERFGPVAEMHMQMDPTNLRIRCIARACSVSYHLLKLNPTKISVCQTVFLRADNLQKLGIKFKDQGKTMSNFLSSAEISAFNVGITLFQMSDYSTAALYFRKALEYLINNQFQEVNADISNTFPARCNTLYDSRKAKRDWDGVLDDVTCCLVACYGHDEATGKIRCKNQIIKQQLFIVWSRFKRDVYHGMVVSEDRFLDVTMSDLLKKALTPDSNFVWELLLEEFQALDRRKGSVPKAAISGVVRRASALARSAFQKGVSSYLLSREGDDYAQRHVEAKRAVAKLVPHATLADLQIQAQVYLALAYIELYVSQQEMLKKKTEEEMESLGPLIQSSTNVEVPPGEDGTSLTSDGMSLDAVSYSYLKLELELKNQEWMVKSLEQWEELVQSGWCPDHYSNIIFCGIKSLGYYFSLNGNSFFSARAWSILLKWAENAKCDEELVLAASELLKLGWTVDQAVLQRCQELIEKKVLVTQDQILFFISIAWSKYFQHKFTESWQTLDEHVLQSSTFVSESPSKSVLLLISQANLLRSLLMILPEELSHLQPCPDVGPIQAGVKAAQTAYTALKCYVSYAQQQKGWDFYGQEWNVLRHFLVGAISVARIYLYTAAQREARFFLKEALSAAQRHASVLRTAEALLELCSIDLILDNTMDCQSKLVLICHLMGVAPPIVPEGENINKKSVATPASPVEIRSDRRKGITARNVPEVPIQVQQDATHRMLQLPLNHQGTSPTTKAREISDGIFPEHVSECICLTCSGELVTSIRCTTVMIQAKLWSLMGFQELATEDFIKGSQLIQSICSRLKNLTKPVTGKTSSKKLFDVPNDLKINEVWAQNKIRWFQTTVISCMELLLEYVLHRSVTEPSTIQPTEFLAPIKSILYELYVGPLDHRVMKLTSVVALVSLQQPLVTLTPEPNSNACDEDNDVIVLDGGLPPKTPALGLRKPIEVPAPRRVRRNLMATKIDDTITIDDDDSDCGFSRRRLGKPQNRIIYSSESDDDSDVIPPSPPPPPIIKTQSRTRTVAKKKEETIPSSTAQPTEKKPSKRGVLKVESSADDSNNRQPVKATGRGVSTRKAKLEESESNPRISASSKSEKNLMKSKATLSSKSESEEIDLSARLAATKINSENAEIKETRPKRTTRSTRK